MYCSDYALEEYIADGPVYLLTTNHTPPTLISYRNSNFGSRFICRLYELHGLSPCDFYLTIIERASEP